MTKSTEHFLWTLVVIVIGSPLIYLIAFSPDRAFWDSVFSGLISTAAALIGGIPIALAIDRALKRKEAIEQEREAEKREKELLNLFKDELSGNLELIKARITAGISLQIVPLKSNLWHACAAAGKLNALRDSSDLNAFSIIYEQIDTVRKIEELAYKAAHTATVSYPGGGTAYEQLMRHARSFDEVLSKNLHSIMSEIEKRLAS